MASLILKYCCDHRPFLDFVLADKTTIVMPLYLFKSVLTHHAGGLTNNGPYRIARDNASQFQNANHLQDGLLAIHLAARMVKHQTGEDHIERNILSGPNICWPASVFQSRSLAIPVVRCVAAPTRSKPLPQPKSSTLSSPRQEIASIICWRL